MFLILQYLHTTSTWPSTTNCVKFHLTRWLMVCNVNCTATAAPITLLFFYLISILLCSSFSFDRFKVSLLFIILRPFIEMKKKTDKKLSIQFTLLCSRASLCLPATTKITFFPFFHLLRCTLWIAMICDVVCHAVGTSAVSYTMYITLYIIFNLFNLCSTCVDEWKGNFASIWDILFLILKYERKVKCGI